VESDRDDEPSGGCSCTTFLVLGMMGLCGFEGFHLASRWGWVAGVAGVLVGVVLAVPATGIALLPVLGVAWLVDRIRGVEP
jgi:uncharacterized protein YqgC (DUF456 family)